MTVAFLASLVEAVEALTIVLAVGVPPGLAQLLGVPTLVSMRRPMISAAG
jgi:uncharacterized membrane protein